MQFDQPTLCRFELVGPEQQVDVVVEPLARVVVQPARERRTLDEQWPNRPDTPRASAREPTCRPVRPRCRAPAEPPFIAAHDRTRSGGACAQASISIRGFPDPIEIAVDGDGGNTLTGTVRVGGPLPSTRTYAKSLEHDRD